MHISAPVTAAPLQVAAIGTMGIVAITVVAVLGFLVCAGAAVQAINARDQSLLSHLNGNFNNDYDPSEIDRLAHQFSSRRAVATHRSSSAQLDREPLLPRAESRSSALPSMTVANTFADPVSARDFFSDNDDDDDERVSD